MCALEVCDIADEYRKQYITPNEGIQATTYYIHHSSAKKDGRGKQGDQYNIYYPQGMRMANILDAYRQRYKHKVGCRQHLEELLCIVA